MDATIKEILKKKRTAQAIVKSCSTAIEALQELCDHSWDNKGHSHNDSIYQCSKCGKEEWR